MLENDLNDTIVAIATPIGESGIGIVRMSGKEVVAIADKVFISKDGKRPSDFKTYTTHYGFIVEPLEASRPVDEVILTIMRAPKSYTKEDIIEINCHGGIIALRRVLDLILENGCRLAQPGEFTKRAFLNGRIDLSQAEAVLDIIRAKTDLALKIGMAQLKGALSGQINKIRDAILGILSILEANIDFPEEEIGLADLKKIRSAINDINGKLKSILDGAKQGRIFREGISVVICGKPNVGKSSLLNALLRQERSIVTSVAGTTRDTIEEVIDIKGIPVKIVDTAGIIEPRDLIEKKAVLRAKKYIESADLVLLLLDGSKRISKEDEVLIRKLKKKTTLVIINKIDLKQKIEKNRIRKTFDPVIEISAREMKNIGLLEEAVANLVYAGSLICPEPILVSNLRHIEELKKTEKLIAQAINSLDNRLSLEFISQGLKDALFHLDGILGKTFSEDLLDKIFGDFCVGK